MRLRFLLVGLGILIGMSGAFAQGCDCAADLARTAAAVSKNHPDFAYMIRGAKEERYRQGLVQLYQEARDNPAMDRDSCRRLLNRYFLLLDDKHITVTLSPRADTVPASRPHPDFRYEALDERTALLRMPTFSRLYAASVDSFYRSLKTQLGRHPDLLIDLRNNTGGQRSKVMTLVALLRASRDRLDHIALLQNDYCASGCEHLVYWLPKKVKGPEIRTFGTNTYGALAYGGTRGYVTPNCRLYFRLPRVTFPYLRRYERVGIEPDEPLPLDTAIPWEDTARAWLLER
jgi:hypothetical protein